MTTATHPEINRPKRYYALLISVVGLTMFGPLVSHLYWARIVLGILVAASLIASVMATRTRGRFQYGAIGMAVLAIIMWSLAIANPQSVFGSVTFRILASGITLLFISTICGIIFSDIFSGEVTGNRLCGAVCLYLLIGICFAIIHMTIEMEDPSAYLDVIDKAVRSPEEIREGRYPKFMYFSFCTLSTVGYGDIVPVSRWARSFSWLEAVFGQIYLAILVSRLVGLHIASSNNSAPPAVE